jgi:hypothetical protein
LNIFYFLKHIRVLQCLEIKVNEDGKVEKYKGKSGEVADLGIGFGAALVIKDRCQIGVGYNTGLETRNLMGTLTIMFGK